MRLAANLNWQEFPAGERLTAELGQMCFLENDVRAAALSLPALIGQPAPHNLAYVSISTGIAAGLILNGQLYRGAHGMAGEIGHIIVDPEGPLCSCSARGCLESVAAGAGDGVAQAIVDKVGLYLGRTLHQLVMTYDVERVVAGGGVSHAREVF